jgi:hypothetical protein
MVYKQLESSVVPLTVSVACRPIYFGHCVICRLVGLRKRMSATISRLRPCPLRILADGKCRPHLPPTFLRGVFLPEVKRPFAADLTDDVEL